MEWLEDRRLEGVGEEGILVGGLETSDEGVELFSFAESPVEEA